jgi:ABC-2 type transport system ATP-binding protein
MAVLRSGTIVAQGTVAQIRGRARQRVEIWFETNAPSHLATLPGIGEPEIDGRRFSAVLTGSARPLIDGLAGQPITSILINEPDLEEAFRSLYEDDPAGDGDSTEADR